MKRVLKLHYQDSRWHSRTLCGKEIERSTGSPLNGDGTVPATRVTESPDDISCRTCLGSFFAEMENIEETEA
jgi:hypothetical protein